MESETKKALSKCMALCSKSEKCILDIRKKLESWQLSENDMQKVIDALVDEKFIDEQRFALSFTRDKFRFNQWGKVKIAFHLRNKSISESTIKQSFEQINETEYFQILRTMLQQKSKSVKAGTDYEKNAKLIRFAQGRGFEYEIIVKALKVL